jgi:hypothetical protein
MTIKKRTVTCHTEGCENENVSITDVLAETVICGCCGGIIEDVK